MKKYSHRFPLVEITYFGKINVLGVGIGSRVDYAKIILTPIENQWTLHCGKDVLEIGNYYEDKRMRIYYYIEHKVVVRIKIIEGDNDRLKYYTEKFADFKKVFGENSINYSTDSIIPL